MGSCHPIEGEDIKTQEYLLTTSQLVNGRIEDNFLSFHSICSDIFLSDEYSESLLCLLRNERTVYSSTRSPSSPKKTRFEDSLNLSAVVQPHNSFSAGPKTIPFYISVRKVTWRLLRSCTIFYVTYTTNYKNKIGEIKIEKDTCTPVFFVAPPTDEW